MTLSLFKFVLVIVVCVVSAVFAADEYIAEMQEQCKAKSDLFSCGKYETARYIARAANGDAAKTNIVNGLVDFVTLNKPEVTDTLFPAARQISTDSQFRKFVKFAQRQVDAFLGSRAISITLPGQARFVDAEQPDNEIVSDSESQVESRNSKKKKVSMLIPLLILFKLFKVKVMLALVLGGVIFIKKVLMFVLLLAPSYLQMLKICKMPHHPHAEEHEFAGNTGFGYGHSPHAHHTSYGKDWAASRAYSLYNTPT